MNTPIVLILMIGVILITIGYMNNMKKCPPPRVEYRFIPRTFDEEQENPIIVSQLFRDMFETPSLWISGFRFSDKPSVEEIEQRVIEN